jgi:hypothetical protein
MAGSDVDHGKSGRPGAEDLGWSSTDRIFCGQAIGKSDDTVYGLYRTRRRGARFSWLSLKTKVGEGYYVRLGDNLFSRLKCNYCLEI